jgi:Zn-dependent protease
MKVSPVFLAIVAAAVTGAVATWTGYGNIGVAVFVFVFASYLMVLCLHEFGHAYSAHRAGDTSIAARGYLDLNPMRYVNPVFSIILPAIYLAYGGIPLPGGAVLVDRTAARSKWEASLISLSGPLTNVVFAVIAMVAVAIGAPSNVDLVYGTHAVFWSAVSFFAFIQIALSILNLIPVPGLDGYGALEPYLRYETRRALEPVRPYGVLLVLLLLFFFPPLRDAFSSAVTSIMNAFGQPSYGPGLGEYYFQFWKH